MVTALVDDLVSISKITQTGKNLGIEVKIASPKDVTTNLNDDFFIVDYVHSYGINAARTIKNAKPDALVVGFYPHVRFYIKDEAEAIGCKAFTNAEFFSKLKDILNKKM